MADPATLEEYQRLFVERTRYEGNGFDTTAISPCPFCCAAEHMRVRVLDSEAAFEKGASCVECGRSWRAVMDRSTGGLSFEIVQTGGPDPAPYLPPMRRLASGTG